MITRIHIGTSGWHYKHWFRVFYPEGMSGRGLLEFYTQHFDTVEVNNSFYHLVAPHTFEEWRESSPRSFRFAVKASRFITHMKKLKDPDSSSAKFFHGVEHLQQKVGPILFQLPPRWQVNVERLGQFLKALPDDYRYVFEFRDSSWLMPEVYDVLHEYNAAFCIHDFADMKIPLEVTADFTYLRFHGPTIQKYSGSYSSAQLEKWAKWIEQRRSKLKAIYVYFNNDIGAAAIKNALSLKSIGGW